MDRRAKRKHAKALKRKNTSRNRVVDDAGFNRSEETKEVSSKWWKKVYYRAEHVEDWEMWYKGWEDLFSSEEYKAEFQRDLEDSGVEGIERYKQEIIEEAKSSCYDAREVFEGLLVEEKYNKYLTLVWGTLDGLFNSCVGCGVDDEVEEDDNYEQERAFCLAELRPLVDWVWSLPGVVRKELLRKVYPEDYLRSLYLAADVVAGNSWGLAYVRAWSVVRRVTTLSCYLYTAPLSLSDGEFIARYVTSGDLPDWAASLDECRGAGMLG
jgi:hypothetical protein